MEIQFRDHATRNVVSLAFGKDLSKRGRRRGETLVEFDRYDESSYSAERDTSSKRLSWGNRRGRRSEKGEGKFN